MPSATRRSSPCTCVRVRSETARMVPRISAVSGITFDVVPALMWATVTTAGSNTSMRRVIIVWMACTISQATGMGSSAWCGADAWPPRPRTTMRSTSDDAMSVPPRRLIVPEGNIDEMCSAKAPVTGLSVPSASGPTSSRSSSSM